MRLFREAKAHAIDSHVIGKREPEMGARLIFNPTLARRMLNERGWSPGKGQVLKVEILCENEERAFRDAERVSTQLDKNISVLATLKCFDPKTYDAQLSLHSFPVYLGRFKSFSADGNQSAALFAQSSRSFPGWKNSLFDSELSQMKSALTEAERKRHARAAQKILIIKDAVLVPLYQEVLTAVTSARVTGLTVNPHGAVLFKQIYLRR